jgi:hypothetical protein|tara:strand:+ start:6388 stop:6567 length:180 start_codon:yes stop_codon:yes gene_type:complete
MVAPDLCIGTLRTPADTYDISNTPSTYEVSWVSSDSNTFHVRFDKEMAGDEARVFGIDV